MVELAGILAGAGQHLGGQQAEDQAVLVGGPDRAVAAQEGGAGALFTAEAERAVEQSVHEPLEADRDLDQVAAEAGGHAVDHAAGDQRLADSGVPAPAGTVGEEVRDGGREVVIRIEQAGSCG